MEDYYTTKEVAELHGVTRGRVTQWISEGEIPATKVNQIWLVRKQDAHKYKRRRSTGRPRSDLRI